MKVVKQRGGLATAPMDVADVVALQALFDGRADEDQQKCAIRWILDGACGVHEVSFVPDNPHMTSFNEGRRFVGKQIGEALRTDPGKLRRGE